MKLLIADDHPIFRKGLQDILQFQLKEATIIEAETGKDALDLITSELPDVAILDIDMPGLNGLEVCKAVRKQNLDIKIIILTMHKDETLCNFAFENGANGYIIKDNSASDILYCIEKVKLGHKCVSPSIKHYLESYNSFRHKKSRTLHQLKELSSTELRTLRLVSQSKTSKEIAELLFVTQKSVENYRSRICKKLQLDSRNNSLTKWILENKAVLEWFNTNGDSK